MKLNWISVSLVLATLLANSLAVTAAPEISQQSAPANAAFFDREGQKLIYFAVLEGLYDLSLPDSVVTKVLSSDNQGHPISFILGCPICHPVYDAFQAYRSRPAFFRSDRRDFATSESSAETLKDVEQLNSDKAMERTAAVGRLVKRWVRAAITKQNLPSAELARWANRLKAMSEVGQSKLSEHQRNGVEAYKLMWSCMLCDGAVKGSKE